jgi:hypothetical protein
MRQIMNEDEETTVWSCGIGFMLLIALCGMFLGGCTTTPKAAAEDVMKAGLYDGMVKAANAPLVEITCAATGCNFASLKVGNPGGAAQMAEVVKVANAPVVSEAGANYRATLGLVGQVASGAVVGHFAAKVTDSIVGGFKSGFASNTAIAGAGFDATGKIASLIPQPPATPAAPTPPTTEIIIDHNTGAVNVGGTQDNSNRSVTNPAPCKWVITYSATGVPNGFSCT